MGKLGDVFKQKLASVVSDAVKDTIAELAEHEQADVQVQQIEVVSHEEVEEDKEKRWTLAWLEDIATYCGFTYTEDEAKRDGILGALKRKQGYCPCAGISIDTLCPCKRMREHNICTCGLFASVYRRQMKSSQEVSILHEE